MRINVHYEQINLCDELIKNNKKTKVYTGVTKNFKGRVSATPSFSHFEVTHTFNKWTNEGFQNVQ